MAGILYSLAAGLLICLQSIFNTKASDKIGLWETTTIVHGIGFVFSLAILMVAGTGQLSKVTEVSRIYLLGGVFGVLIVFSVMKGMASLGPTYAVSLLLITQLITAMVVDSNGWFGLDKMPVTTNKLVGIVIMVVGIVIFKIK